MKACGRRSKDSGAVCGVLFEGSGSYCRDCRNDYQREYYARRKSPSYRSVQDDMGISCAACGEGLRSNTMVVVTTKETDVTICERCKAVVMYLAEKVEEETQEYLIDLVMELREMQGGQVEANEAPTSATNYIPTAYVPVLTTPPDPNAPVFKACVVCDSQARKYMYTCKEHEDYEETYYNSNAAKLDRGELERLV